MVAEPSLPIEIVTMPPRMPMLPAGVVTLTSVFLLIAPQTKRSMVISLLTPTDSAEPSVNTRCARSLAPVRTRSLENTSMPTRRMRSFWAGGVPRGSPLTAEATPTVCAMAGRVKPIRRKAIRSNRDMGDSLEPPAHAQQGVEGLECVVADRRGALEVGGLA